ncbi:MAG: porin family protein [Flavobacteriaceae bacterium]
MKKTFLIIAVVALCFNLNAQSSSTSDEGIKFGIKAGVNFASITGDETDDLSGLTGFHFGAVLDISISEKFSVQPELLYSTQGAEYKDSDAYDGKFKLNYINIPVMAKYYVAEGFSIQAGPQIGFNTSAKDEYKYTGVDPGFSDDSGTDDIKDFVKGTDFGINFGLGYEMQTGLNFSARYCLGLSDINDLPDNIDPGFSVGDIKNQNGVFQISVGYMF